MCSSLLIMPRRCVGHFHSDGGAELVAAVVLTFLHKSSHSPHDTLQMNYITERWVRSLKEKVLCMLRSGGLPWNVLHIS